MPKKRKIKVGIKKLGNQKAVGLAFQGLDYIELDPRVKPKTFLINALHEIGHILHENDSEAMVEKNAQTTADVLWRLNFRRIYDENKLMEPRK